MTSTSDAFSKPAPNWTLRSSWSEVQSSESLALMVVLGVPNFPRWQPSRTFRPWIWELSVIEAYERTSSPMRT